MPPIPSVAGWTDHRHTLEALAWKYRTCSPWRSCADELASFARPALTDQKSAPAYEAHPRDRADEGVRSDLTRSSTPGSGPSEDGPLRASGRFSALVGEKGAERLLHLLS